MGPLVFVIVLLLFCVAGVLRALKPKKPRQRATGVSDRDFEVKLQKLSDECTDGSLKVYIPKRRAPKPPPKPLDLGIVWTQYFRPLERYKIEYADRHGEYSERVVDLSCVGSVGPHDYLGIIEAGKFKTLRADRVLKVEAVPLGFPMLSALRVLPTVATLLPNWPVEGAVFRVHQTNNAARHWTVNLNSYSCTCPEKRVRIHMGIQPGSLGIVCNHMAEAILANLPPDAGWEEDVLAYLGNPHKVSIGNLL